MHILGWLYICITWSFVTCMTHEPGYCAMYDNCGKKSFFGAQLPCPNNTMAVEPEEKSIEILKDICGADFSMDKVCCSYDQIVNLKTNLKKVDPLISSCPACRKNFYNFFCEFTCSSNQSMFVDIVKTANAADTKKLIVTELDQFVEPSTAGKFFDSCKNLKFSATNGYAMDLIGGGARNFKEFLKFLGDEKPLLGGSPFQINFKYDKDESTDKGIVLRDSDMRPCDDPDYKCACSDCLTSCPELPAFKGYNDKCSIGRLPCFTFASIMVLVFFIISVAAYHIFIMRNNKNGTSSSVLTTRDFDPSNYVIQTKAKTNAFIVEINERLMGNIEGYYEKLGHFAATFPAFTIGSSLLFALMLSLGTVYLEFETSPINLWVSPNEPHLKNYNYFEESFGEWFRIEQIIISNKDESSILNWDNIKWWFESELALQEFNDNDEILSLDEFCFKPLGETCAIESFTQYFGGYIGYLTEDTWEKQILDCTNSPVNCLPSFQQPLKKNLLFNEDDVLNSKAFIVTILINSNLSDSLYTSRVERYENKLKDFLLNLQEKNPTFKIAFSTEVSLTQELNKSTNTDVNIIIISYLAMFLYASITLGGKIPLVPSLKSLIYTRFQLGLSGIIIILLSVSSSLGFFALIGLKSTLIIAEVIPFLILAVGIDNIFLLVHELNSVNLIQEHKDKSLEERVAICLKQVGPSCLISAILQISMFLLAARVDMPAVKNFAYYSAGAIFVNFLLQMTCFVSVLALDQRRLESGRLDCFPWIKTSIQLDTEEDSEQTGDPINEDQQDKEAEYFDYNFSKWIRKYYAPKILSKTAKPKILTFFILWLGISLSTFPYIELGLDQNDALPRDSYLIDYFKDLSKYLNVGPPIFFVLKDLDLTKRENQQKICGKFSTCNEFSLANVVEQEHKRGEASTVVDPLSNWLDDFFTWLNPNLDQCCRLKKGSKDFCSPKAPERMCEVCYENHDPPYNINLDGLPEKEEFMYFFDEWIELPSDPCPLGGKAPYGNAIKYNGSLIQSSYFRTSHSPLRTQLDFINGFKNSLRIVEEIKSYQEKPEDFEVFAFSPFYVFFVQYQTIIGLTFKLLGIAILLIWLISLILLGSLRSSLVLVATIALIMVNIGGVLAVWHISLNAVSLVNLIICVGLSVEFCIHITRGFVKSSDKINDDDETVESIYDSFMNNVTLLRDSRTVKAYRSLASVGSSVLGGITLTKFIGVFVLAFTRSKIFETYYFRMWISLIFIAGLHAFCLLPVLLSYFG